MIEQIFIVVLSGTAAWLTQDRRESWRRWACIVGLAVQPAWFYATYKASQWGMFGCSFWYTLVWLRGFKYHWWEKFARHRSDFQGDDFP